MIESYALAATVVSSFLIPYVKIGAEKLAETLGESLGDQIGGHVDGVANKLWARVKAAFSSEDDKVILTQFEKRPDMAKTLVQDILKEKFDNDPTMAQEIASLINAPASDGKSASAYITQADIAGILDARGANFVGASHFNLTGVQISDLSKRPPEEKV